MAQSLRKKSWKSNPSDVPLGQDVRQNINSFNYYKLNRPKGQFREDDDDDDDSQFNTNHNSFTPIIRHFKDQELY